MCEKTAGYSGENKVSGKYPGSQITGLIFRRTQSIPLISSHSGFKKISGNIQVSYYLLNRGVNPGKYTPSHPPPPPRGKISADVSWGKILEVRQKE